MARGRDDRRVELLAALKDDTLGAAVADQDPVHPRVRADLRAEGPRAALEGGGDGTHPALGHAPGAERAVADVTDRVVGHHVAGPPLVRSRPRADQPVDRHRRLDLVGREEPVEQVGHAHRHEPGDLTDRPDVQASEAPGESELFEQVAGSFRTDLRRGGHQERSEHRREPVHPRVPPLERLGVRP
jgi:hypothetical protein